jgi:ParB family transcriptional regulator, chromosome partitioning protein
VAPRKLNLSNTALLSRATARASSLFAVDEDRSYRELTLAEIQVNPNQPRKHFDPAELESLAASIDRHGLLQPIVVREIGADRYEILAGERRYRAFELRGRAVIPAIVMSTDDPKVLALVENVQRVDLHALEIATSLHELIEEKGLTQEEAGTLIGKSQAHIARLLGLLRLPPALLDEISGNRQVATSLLLEIAEIDDPALQAVLWAQAKNGLTVRALRQAKQEGKGAPSQATPSYERAIKAIRSQLQAIRRLLDQGAPLSRHQADDLDALRREIDELLDDGGTLGGVSAGI